MAVDVTTAMFIANILHASVPGFLWVLLSALAYFTLGPQKNAYQTAAGYMAKIMLLILAGYSLLGAFTGFLLLTRLDNVATIIGADLQPIVGAIEAFHGAIDVDIPDMVKDYAVRDIQAFMLIPMTGLISIVLSYWFAHSFPVMVGQAAWIMVTYATPGYFILRAFRTDQIVFWSIVGFISVVTHTIANLGYSRVSWSFKHWQAWLPLILFVLVRCGLWVTFIISNPTTSAVPLDATEWIYPGFVTVEAAIMAILVYLTVDTRFPAKGWSWNTIFYNTLTAQHFATEAELPTGSKMGQANHVSTALGYKE